MMSGTFSRLTGAARTAPTPAMANEQDPKPIIPTRPPPPPPPRGEPEEPTEIEPDPFDRPSSPPRAPSQQQAGRHQAPHRPTPPERSALIIKDRGRSIVGGVALSARSSSANGGLWPLMIDDRH